MLEVVLLSLIFAFVITVFFISWCFYYIVAKIEQEILSVAHCE